MTLSEKSAGAGHRTVSLHRDCELVTDLNILLGHMQIISSFILLTFTSGNILISRAWVPEIEKI